MRFHAVSTGSPCAAVLYETPNKLSQVEAERDKRRQKNSLKMSSIQPTLAIVDRFHSRLIKNSHRMFFLLCFLVTQVEIASRPTVALR